jgi:hypothetical protein
MKDSAMSRQPSRPLSRAGYGLRLCAGIAAGAVVIGWPSVVGATTVHPPKTPPTTALATTTSKLCQHVSAQAVSADFLTPVPPPMAYTKNVNITYHVPAGYEKVVGTKDYRFPRFSFSVSAVDTICTYGLQTTLASLPSSVELSVEVLSKAPTALEFEYLTSLASSAHFVMTPVPAVGKMAYRYTLFEAGIHGQGISVAQGQAIYGAFVYTDKLTTAKLVALGELAQKL